MRSWKFKRPVDATEVRHKGSSNLNHLHRLRNAHRDQAREIRNFIFQTRKIRGCYWGLGRPGIGGGAPVFERLKIRELTWLTPIQFVAKCDFSNFCHKHFKIKEYRNMLFLGYKGFMDFSRNWANMIHSISTSATAALTFI